MAVFTILFPFTVGPCRQPFIIEVQGSRSIECSNKHRQSRNCVTEFRQITEANTILNGQTWHVREVHIYMTFLHKNCTCSLRKAYSDVMQQLYLIYSWSPYRLRSSTGTVFMNLHYAKLIKLTAMVLAHSMATLHYQRHTVFLSQHSSVNWRINPKPKRCLSIIQAICALVQLRPLIWFFSVQ